MTTDIALYVHIPFCKRKCNYCDFCSFTTLDKDLESKYLNRLITEISEYSPDNAYRVSSVFFGGGTPTLFSAKSLTDILGALNSRFAFSSDAEITVEANPGTVTGESLYELRASGFNRISFGLQSIHENELKKLGRIHSYTDFLHSYDLARRVGFNNVNVDLMYGIPYQTLSSFASTLEEIVGLSPEHISSYGLIVEEGTPFFKEKEALPLPNEEEEYGMYFQAVELLCKAGYRHYEISNYAKAGKECKHNLTYWNDCEYIGFGTSAHSYFKGERYANSSFLTSYLKREGRIAQGVSREDEEFEYAMLRFRLADGLVFHEYEKRFGAKFLSEERHKRIKKYIDGGYAVLTSDALRLTDKGLYISNSFLSDLL